MNGIRHYIIVVFIFLCCVIKAQFNKLDSLKLLLKTAQHDTTRVNTLMTIGNLYQNINPDTAIYYHAQARNLNQKLNNPLKIGEALKAEGWDNFVKGNNDDDAFR